MIFIRLAFLILALTSLNYYAQTQPQTSEQNNKQKAYKFDEYGKITTKELKVRYVNFIRRVLESYGTGNIVVYAPNKRKTNLRVEAVERFLRISSAGGIIDFDTSRITFVRIRERNEKTEFWVVPKDAEPPKIKSEVYKFGAITGLKYNDCKTIREFIQEGQGSFQTHIMVLYSSNFDRIIRNLRKKCSMEFRGNYGGPYFSIMNGDFRSKQFIELWIVPEGQEPPISKRQKE